MELRIQVTFCVAALKGSTDLIVVNPSVHMHNTSPLNFDHFLTEFTIPTQGAIYFRHLKKIWNSSKITDFLLETVSVWRNLLSDFRLGGLPFFPKRRKPT
jgi:hypothetical protein